MKLVPTASQTVGPFFSIGLDSLCQKTAETTSAANRVAVRGTVHDGDGKPIPDAVLEFWSASQFVRVATTYDGTFSASMEIPVSASGTYLDVLIFMRGLLRHVYSRVYFGERGSFKNDSVLKLIPEGRIATLFAKPQETPNRFMWNVVMQGENETVFFEY